VNFRTIVQEKQIIKSTTSPDTSLVTIEEQIHLLRGQRVVLSTDLAKFYGVSAKRLNEQVKRNRERFPKDFLFSLTDQEVSNLRSQLATSSWGDRPSIYSYARDYSRTWRLKKTPAGH
jgi:hypothetical protein